MAKKVSPIVIPAVIDTSGVDKGVSQIQSKLKSVGGSAGVGGGGGFGNGGGASAAATSALSTTAAATAFALSASGRVSAAAAGRGTFEGLSKGARSYASSKRITSGAVRRQQEMFARNRDFLANAGSGMTAWEYLDDAYGAQDRYFQGMQRENRLRRAVGRGMSKRAAFAKIKAGAESGMGRFVTGAALLATGNFERTVGSQFQDYNAFQNYDAAANRRLVSKYSKAQRNVPNTFQSFMLGANRYGGGAVEGGGQGIALGMRTMAMGLGALTSNPFQAIPELLNPQSSLYLNAQGIPQKQSETPWADMFGTWWQNFTEGTNPVKTAMDELKRQDVLSRASKQGGQ